MGRIFGSAVLPSNRDMKMDLFDRGGMPRTANAVDEKGRQVDRYVGRCIRCGGQGGWQGWPGFTCFRCGGSGTEVFEERLYTAAELARLNKRAQKAKASREARAAAKLAAAQAEQAARTAAWRAENPAVASALDYLVAVEDERLGPPEHDEVPRKRFWREMRASIEQRAIPLTDRQREVIDNAIACLEAARAAHHFGTPDQRYHNVGMRVAYSREVGVDRFGRPRYLNRLETTDGAPLVWWSSRPLKEGATLRGSFTVKAHEEYRGQPQTVILRLVADDEEVTHA